MIPRLVYNYEIESMNEEYAIQAQKTGILYYCIDYDEEYTHTKAYSDGYFYNQWLESLNLSNVVQKVYLYSNNTPIIFANGERTSSPAIRGSSGGWLIPLRDVVEAFGGKVVWDRKEGIIVQWGNTTYHLVKTDDYFNVEWKEEYEVRQRQFDTMPDYVYYAALLPPDFYSDLLGLKLSITDSQIDIQVQKAY